MRAGLAQLDVCALVSSNKNLKLRHPVFNPEQTGTLLEACKLCFMLVYLTTPCINASTTRRTHARLFHSTMESGSKLNTGHATCSVELAKLGNVKKKTCLLRGRSMDTSEQNGGLNATHARTHCFKLRLPCYARMPPCLAVVVKM